MLKKNYSTLALLFASNVLDGGKDIEKVPDQLKNDVKELVKSLEEDAEKEFIKSEGNSANELSHGKVAEHVTNPDKNSQEVAK